MLMVAMTVVLLMNDITHKDEVRTSSDGIMTVEECARWKADMETAPVGLVDPITKRKTSGVFYQCVPVAAPSAALLDVVER